MKKEDLMIGDWVNIQTEKDDEPMYSQVEQLWECEIDADFQTDYENVYPIPLISEILEKNGFEKKVWWKYRESDVTTYTIGEGFYIELSENEFWLVDNCSDDGDYGYESNWIVEVKYVHDLQHTLRLCKIDKEIIL